MTSEVPVSGANETNPALTIPPTAEAVSSGHPILGSLIRLDGVETTAPTQLDTYEDNLRLERASRAFSFVSRWFLQPNLTPLERALAPLTPGMHVVERINNQFGTKIIPALLCEDVEESQERFRAVDTNTVHEEMVLLVNDEQFVRLHDGLHQHLADTEADIEHAAQENLERINKTDRQQFNAQETRSLEFMSDHGISIIVDPEKADEIFEARNVAGEGDLPLTEYIKNKRVLKLSGFDDSKISLAVHDFIDHIWMFEMLRATGILDRYEDLFDSVGNPEATDIFKREGEMVASISYGVRLFQTMPSGFGPLYRASHIEEQMMAMYRDGRFEDRHLLAHQGLLSGPRRGSIEWQSLGFAFSNYITELDEQRRKYGRIKQRDPRTKKIVGELDPFSPDYMCFFYEAHHELHQSKNKHRDDLFRFHLLLEDYLTSYADGLIDRDNPLILRLSELRRLDFSRTTLPPTRIRWMYENYGFTATRDAIV